MLTADEALHAGYMVDPHAPGRPIAYRGPRFAPTAVLAVYTRHEEELRAALADIARLGDHEGITAKFRALLALEKPANTKS